MNLGQLLGPLVGGALYQSGGFYLPFVTMGALQAGMGVVSMVAMKEIPGTQISLFLNSLRLLFPTNKRCLCVWGNCIRSRYVEDGQRKSLAGGGVHEPTTSW